MFNGIAMPEDKISVTDLVKAAICPMKLYLVKSAEKKFNEPVSYTVAKLVSYHLGEPLFTDDIWEELEAILPNNNEAQRILEQMLEVCGKITWRHADQYDMPVFSEKYGIYGRIDRYFDDSFSVVKSGAAPTHGVYFSDRLRSVCYSLCLEEMFGKSYYGRVEYLGSGTIRSVVVEPQDRRTFVLALRIAKKTLSGEIPKVARGQNCNWCEFADMCSAVEKPRSLFNRIVSKE